MQKDPAIDAVRDVRHKISAQYGHDTKRLIQHYKELQERYPLRLLENRPAPPSTSKP